MTVHHHTGARGDQTTRAYTFEAQRLNALTYSFGHDYSLIGVGHDRKYRQLFAPQTDGYVAFTDFGTHCLRNAHKAPVTHMMSVGIVDSFEVIQIEHQQSHPADEVPIMLFQHLGHRVIPIEPRIKTSQRIVDSVL